MFNQVNQQQKSLRQKKNRWLFSVVVNTFALHIKKLLVWDEEETQISGRAACVSISFADPLWTR